MLKRRNSAVVILMMAPEQLASLVERHAAALVLYARQYCHAPEDVVQAAFLKLASSDPPKPVPWLYRVVRNAAIDAARAERRRQKHETAAATQIRPWFEPDEEPDALDVETVTVAMAELPLEQREIIVAHLWGELTFEEIAETVGSSAATCYRRYWAGIAQIRDQLRVPCPTNPKSN